MKLRSPSPIDTTSIIIIVKEYWQINFSQLLTFFRNGKLWAMQAFKFNKRKLTCFSKPAVNIDSTTNVFQENNNLWQLFSIKLQVGSTAWEVSIFGVILRHYHIQSECGKIRTRITPNTHTFYVVFRTLLKILKVIWWCILVTGNKT